MKSMLISVPDEVHSDFKLACRRRGVQMYQTVVNLMGLYAQAILKEDAPRPLALTVEVAPIEKGKV